MKMDKPSPVALAVEESQNLSQSMSSTADEEPSAMNETASVSGDQGTDSRQDQDPKVTDCNGNADTDEDNLLNYIAELSKQTQNNVVAADEVDEEELLGEKPATPPPVSAKERFLLGDNGIHDSPMSRTSVLTVSEFDPNGASTSYLSTTSSPSRGSVHVSDFTSSAESTPPQKHATTLMAKLFSSVVGNQDQTTSANGEKDEEGEVDGATGNNANADMDEIQEKQEPDETTVSTVAPVEPETSSGQELAVDHAEEDPAVEREVSKEPEESKQDHPMEIEDVIDSINSAKDNGSDVDTEREEFLDKFLAFCQRFRNVAGSLSTESIRDRFRLTDLLAWFLEEEGRPVGPLTFQKRLRKTGFTVPASISLPPSQVVELIVEAAPEKSLKDIVGKGVSTGKTDDAPETASQRYQFSRFPAPNMTRFLFDIGYNLVSETAYRGILSKAVSELSSSGSSASAEATVVERQSQMVEHIRRVYEDAKKQNQPLKLKTYRCPIDYCSFTTETQLQLYEHRRKPHKKTHRWECALCMKFSSSNDEDMEDHYNFEHGFTSSAKWEVLPSRAPCPLCDQDFPFKGQMKNHLRVPGQCPMNVRHAKVTSGTDDEVDVLNLHLWSRVDERHAPAPKVQEQKALTLVRRCQPSARVDDVVSLVAAGAGQLRSPPKPSMMSLASSNLPRLLPSVLRSTQTAHQQRLIQQQQQQQLVRQIVLAQQQQLQRPRAPPVAHQLPSAVVNQQPTIQRAPPKTVIMERHECEVCDAPYMKKLDYLKHLQGDHRKLLDKTELDLLGAAPLACSRCRDRFYSYEGLERHLLMEHNLVTNELLTKAQKRQDSGKCRICTRIYAFNLLQHLVQDHQRTLCSAEIVYSCDVCHFQCNSYVQLELHLRTHHTETAVGLRTNVATSASAPSPAHTQPSRAMSVIAQRQQQQQQAMLLLQQAPRLAQQQVSNRSTTQPQTAAAVLNAAIANHKRSFPSTLSVARTQDQLERPPKLIKMAEPGARSSAAVPVVSNSSKVSRIQNPMPSSSTASQQLTNNQRKQLRYCCTPCELKFISYEAVLKHWVERHLKPLRVPLCRIDKCEPCQEKLTSSKKEKVNGAESTEGGDQDAAEGPSKKAAGEEKGGLILDLELPELCGDEVMTDDVVEVLPPPKEVICLD